MNWIHTASQFSSHRIGSESPICETLSLILSQFARHFTWLFSEFSRTKRQDDRLEWRSQFREENWQNQTHHHHAIVLFIESAFSFIQDRSLFDEDFRFNSEQTTIPLKSRKRFRLNPLHFPALWHFPEFKWNYCLLLFQKSVFQSVSLYSHLFLLTITRNIQITARFYFSTAFKNPILLLWGLRFSTQNSSQFLNAC
jgi:hypothetical protein